MTSWDPSTGWVAGATNKVRGKVRDKLTQMDEKAQWNSSQFEAPPWQPDPDGGGQQTRPGGAPKSRTRQRLSTRGQPQFNMQPPDPDDPNLTPQQKQQQEIERQTRHDRGSHLSEDDWVTLQSGRAPGKPWAGRESLSGVGLDFDRTQYSFPPIAARGGRSRNVNQGGKKLGQEDEEQQEQKPQDKDPLAREFDLTPEEQPRMLALTARKVPTAVGAGQQPMGALPAGPQVFPMGSQTPNVRPHGGPLLELMPGAVGSKVGKQRRGNVIDTTGRDITPRGVALANNDTPAGDSTPWTKAAGREGGLGIHGARRFNEGMESTTPLNSAASKVGQTARRNNVGVGLFGRSPRNTMDRGPY